MVLLSLLMKSLLLTPSVVCCVVCICSCICCFCTICCVRLRRAAAAICKLLLVLLVLLLLLLVMLSLLLMLRLLMLIGAVNVACGSGTSRIVDIAIVVCCWSCCWLGRGPAKQAFGSSCLCATCINDAFEHVVELEHVAHRAARSPVALVHRADAVAPEDGAARAGSAGPACCASFPWLGPAATLLPAR